MGGFKASVTQEEAEKILEHMSKGHPECTIPIKSRVYKSSGDQDDVHSLGAFGTVIGSDFVEGKEVYLVEFDGAPFPTFIMGSKISKV